MKKSKDKNENAKAANSEVKEVVEAAVEPTALDVAVTKLEKAQASLATTNALIVQGVECGNTGIIVQLSPMVVEGSKAVEAAEKAVAVEEFNVVRGALLGQLTTVVDAVVSTFQVSPRSVSFSITDMHKVDDNGVSRRVISLLVNDADGVVATAKKNGGRKGKPWVFEIGGSQVVMLPGEYVDTHGQDGDYPPSHREKYVTSAARKVAAARGHRILTEGTTEA